jgi:amino acid adenylation domain-containing protein/non-ribosomal peptide synthase protein (TIGR01720 family)
MRSKRIPSASITPVSHTVVRLEPIRRKIEMSELYNRLSALSPQQRALLEARLKQKGLHLPKSQSIVKRTSSGPLPLSIDQEQLWVVDQIDPCNTAYNISTAMRLSGRLDVAAIGRAINEIVRRHEALRTTFRAIDGRPAQVVAPPLNVPLPLTDLSQEAGGPQEVMRLATAEISRPFDLARGPLVRARILRLGEDEHVLAVAMHHIIADSWSFGLFNRELLALYEAYVAGRPSPLAELPIQYADYAIWQREWLSGDLLEEKLAHWKGLLAGAPLLCHLPTDRPRPTAQSFRGGSRFLTVPEDLKRALKDLANRERATMFMTMLAAFNVLLFRYSNQRDILIGSPIANRNHPEVQNLIGYFLNMLVLRTRLRAGMTFRDLLAHVRETSLAAYAHQDLPFARLVQELQSERDIRRNPLFQVCFVYLDFQEPEAELQGLRLREIKVDTGRAMFDLTLALTENADGLDGYFEYASDLFNAGTVERMASHFQNLLSSIVANPDQRLSQLTLLDEEERRQVLSDCNQAVSYTVSTTLHERFQQQAEAHPDRIALSCGAKQLSYRQLDEQANQLARYLRRPGVGPEQLVGLLVERGPWMVIAMLGVLKAGGAYLPLDASSPAARLQAMLEDSGVQLVLTQAGLGEQARAAAQASGVEVVVLEEEQEEIGREERKAVASGAEADNLAYVIYTSGSTGRPKGVAVTHRSICNRLLWEQHTYPLDETDRVLQITPLNFDVSVCEIFAPLWAGAQLVQAEAEGHKDSAYLAKTIAARDITFINVVPAILQVLLDEPELASCRALQRVYCGGEAMSVQLKNRFLARARATLVNLYGPTEATVDTTYWICNASDNFETPPIGKPIANAEVYLLDDCLEPMPIGLPGDLYIGGLGLARGYLQRADLTAARFIPNPFNGRSGARLYRSGDQARRLTDGNLAFIGRHDEQVKIRGLRIELGEIEAAIMQHPQIREAVATLSANARGIKRLVAYVVTANGVPVAESELREFISERLPDYMIPAEFVRLDALPLLPSGKLDRQALPDPAHSASAEADHAPARSEVEETLVRIWSALLGIERIGIHDNFFRLGGDSILSIQIVARANEAGLRLTPRQLFQCQTIAELAAVAGVEQVVAAEQGLISGEVPLTPIQRWFFEQEFVEPNHWNMAVMLELPFALDAAIMRTVIERMLEHHDVLRMRFRKDESGWRQLHADEGGEHPFRTSDLASASEPEQRAAIEKIATELQASLDLSAGPLLRVCWFDLGAGKNGRLLIIIHHLVVDAVSWRLLLEDIQSAYRDLSAGAALHLMPKTTSFKQWAESLQDYANSPAAQSELRYWLDQMSKPFTPLPLDSLEGVNLESSAQSVFVCLGPEETRALLHAVPAAYRTQINDALLAALAEAFAGWMDAPYLLIEVEGHGREELIPHVDLSRTLGWFTITYPVVLELEKDGDVGARLKRVKEHLRAIPGRGIGYGVLGYLSEDAAAKPLREFSRPEVSFNYLGQLDAALDTGAGFRIAPESAGATRNRAASRSHLLEIEASISDGRLRCTFSYSENLHRRQTIEQLAENYLAALRKVIEHCRTSGARGATPSDFPEARLNQSDLDKFLSAIGGAKQPPVS